MQMLFGEDGMSPTMAMSAMRIVDTDPIVIFDTSYCIFETRHFWEVFCSLGHFVPNIPLLGANVSQQLPTWSQQGTKILENKAKHVLDLGLVGSRDLGIWGLSFLGVCVFQRGTVAGTGATRHWI